MVMGTYRTSGDYIVAKYNLIGTDTVFFAAWEPSSLVGPHHAITTFGGKWYGQIGTREPSEAVRALPPMTEERAKSVRAHYAREAQFARQLIRQVFPEAANGQDDGCEIRMR